MALTQRLQMRQSQALVMTPQLMQAIKLLQLSNLDLAAYVEGELERRHRQQLDGLLQRWRQDELLGELRLELLVDGHGQAGVRPGAGPVPAPRF